MTKPLSLAMMLWMASTALSFAAPPQPDLSENAINSASLADWTARRDAAKAEADPKKAPSGNEAGEAQPAPTEGEGSNEAGEKAEEEKAADAKDAPDPFLIRLQVLLDRAHASPGVIDGRSGGNTDKAIRAYEEMQGLETDGTLDESLWSKLSADAGPAVKSYQLTKEDVAGPYVPDLPSDYGEMAKLDRLAYRDAAEMLAERFHMDEVLIRSLNPEADFKTEGQTILVADPGADPETKVDRIVIDKSKGELIAYAEDGRIVLMDPATIGSEDTPSPSGTMKVKGSAREPKYEYDPKKNFQQGQNRKKLTLPPGPNGPVGSVWIDLSKPTYGIHGTPEPSQIDKTASHGCVRLTNWDAEALSRLVKPLETAVEFKG